MTQITLKIDGMQCGMCESHMNDAVRAAFPVKKVTSSHSKGETVIVTEQDIPDELRSKLEDFYADLYQDYYAGRKIDYEAKLKEEGYRLWDRFMNPSIQFRQVEGMMKDSMVENNNAEIPNPIFQVRESHP